ncbi:sigma-70 family RNA polymerase sigma factor [Baekduia sp. Peel2402]|uniref:sigma-70 family RNA polymerase sigma factor n=1 Tax=Baekduia sp. Peel2402 TaxID=3458296 RepID=UPI00403EB134
MKSSALRHPARLAGASLLRLQSDERLAELAGSGHESAFDAIVDRYRTPLLRYCTGIVGPSRAEDAVQQALINAHDALQRIDDVRNLRSWLYRIAHNASLNVLRAVRDDVPLDEYELAASRGGGASAAAAGPAESFERSERFRSTLAALQALPERQRAALVLRELEGRSHEEIAAALGVTKGSARQHLMRARVAVRTAVTAVTPYPLVVRLAEWASASAAGGSGWVDAAATAGAGASLAKLTAGLAATGALVGGAAVGTEHVVHRGSGASVSAGAAELPRAAERSAERVVKRASEVVVAVPAEATPAAATAAPAPVKKKASSPAPRRERRSAPRDGGGPKAKAPVSSPAAPVAPVTTSHRGRGGSDSHDDDRSERDSHRGRDADRGATPPRRGRQEKGDKRGSSERGKKGDRSPSSEPPTSHRGGKGEDASKGGGESSGSGSGSGSGSSKSSGRGSGSGSGSTTTTTTDSGSSSGSDSGGETPSATTTTTEPPPSTTTTSPVDSDDEG